MNNQNSRTVVKLSTGNRNNNQKDKLKRKSKNPLEFSKKYENQDSRKYIYDDADENQLEGEDSSFETHTK